MLYMSYGVSALRSSSKSTVSNLVARSMSSTFKGRILGSGSTLVLKPSVIIFGIPQNIDTAFFMGSRNSGPHCSKSANLYHIHIRTLGGHDIPASVVEAQQGIRRSRSASNAISRPAYVLHTSLAQYEASSAESELCSISA